ncbi:MAG: 7TM diverse intracellular signaling domain-containing protein [Patescibacteria group bacterium]|nr:7TM diverse intracellular signaling domain-containing protein [Patescibacteria group bacterium]
MIASPIKLWAGAFYLANKIFFSRAERSQNQEKKRINKILSWTVYLIGLPAWVYILYTGNDIIAAFVEMAGAFSMATGLILAIKRKGRPPKWFYWIALVITSIGIGLSFYKLRGLSSYTQILELGLALGFLIGTFLLGVKDNFKGYLWFILMNGCCAALMLARTNPILFAQQLASIFFVLDAYRIRKRR